MGEDSNRKNPELEKLNQQLEEVKKFRPTGPGQTSSGNAAQVAVDFASATAVGTLLGWGFDKWQHTLPWGLLVGMLIGTAAGIKLMFQTMANSQNAETKTNDERTGN